MTSVPGDDGFRKYLAAGGTLSTVTRARAEEVVRDLMSAGDSQRSQAQQWVDDVIVRSRAATEELIEKFRKHVSGQLEAHGIEPEDLAKQVSDVLKRTAATGRSATSDAATKVSDTANAAKRTMETAADKGRAATKRGRAGAKGAGHPADAAVRRTAPGTAKGNPPTNRPSRGARPGGAGD